LKYWLLSLFQCRWCYHFLWGKCYPFWSLGCYHLRVLRMLSFYGLNVIIFFPGMLSFSEPANVIIFVLSFFLVQILCYHLCYHLMLSFLVIISPLFLFPENVTHSFHSCVCERFIYFHYRSAYSRAGKYVDQFWDHSQIHECGNWDWCRTIPFVGIYKWDSHCSVGRKEHRERR